MLLYLRALSSRNRVSYYNFQRKCCSGCSCFVSKLNTYSETERNIPFCTIAQRRYLVCQMRLLKYLRHFQCDNSNNMTVNISLIIWSLNKSLKTLIVQKNNNKSLLAKLTQSGIPEEKIVISV